MSGRQLKINYKVNLKNENFNMFSAHVYKVDIPEMVREVNQYVSNKHGVVLTPQKEVYSEFTLEADLETSEDGDDTGDNTGKILSNLYSLLDSDYDTVDVTIQAIERIGGGDEETWSIVAEDCMLTNVSGTAFQADDDAEVARVTVTLLPTVVKKLEKRV